MEELESRLEQGRRLIEQGLYDQAVILCGQTLEAILRAIYQDIVPRLKPSEQEAVSKALEKHGRAIDKLTLGELFGLFHDVKLFDVAARVTKGNVAFLKFANTWIDLRNRAAHPENPISRPEAEACLANMRLYVHQIWPTQEPAQARSAAPALPSWRQAITPHRDIREGRFDESVYAADLSDVVAGDRGPLEYRDPKLFFQRTYPTQGLLNLTCSVLGRLAGTGKGEPIVQIQTPFGGGKTHSLIALYHCVAGRVALEGSEAIARILAQCGLASVPEARVAVFVGTVPDALRGKAPWGELAGQLGDYALLEEHDRRRRAPGKDLLRRLIGDTPTLILMDEIAEYAVKARDFSDQLMAFLQELTETVKALPRSALVVTLPSSAPYGEEGERALQQLQRIFGRMEAVYSPVEGEEAYAVIRRRLFEVEPASANVRKVADGFWELYQKLGDDVPRDVRDPAYRDKLRKAYPFHPDLIDTLFERWSTFPTFQRTRGVLQLLARVVGDLYRREHPAPLIQPAHINLSSADIRQAFLKHIGNEYEGVIASDIAGTDARGPRIDREMGSEYARFGIASGLAASIFFGSFSGSEKKGIGVQRLRVAVLRDQIPSALVGDALGRLEEELWYLHAEGGLYAFSNQPNLNRILVEREEAVADPDINAEIEKRLREAAGTEFAVRTWPKGPDDIPESKTLQVALLGPDYPRQAPSADEFVADLIGKHGTTFRTYKNTLLVLAPDAGELSMLRQQVKRYLALRSIQADKELVRRLSDQTRKNLDERLRSADKSIQSGVLSTYRWLSKAKNSGVEWFDIGLPTVGEKISLARRVREYLEANDLFLSKIGPAKLLEKAVAPEDQEKRLSDIYEAFLRFPGLPMIAGEDVILSAVSEGARTGVFGVRVGSRMYLNEAPPSFGVDSVLVRREAIPSPGPSEVEPGAGSTSSLVQPSAGEGVGVGSSASQPMTGLRTFRIRMRVPWDKLSDVVKGVVIPLRNDGADLEIEVYLEAHSGDRRIRKVTLDRYVGETLSQIGAEVVDESRE